MKILYQGMVLKLIYSTAIHKELMISSIRFVRLTGLKVCLSAPERTKGYWLHFIKKIFGDLTIARWPLFLSIEFVLLVRSPRLCQELRVY